MTTAGVSAPTTYNSDTQKFYFVTKHACSHCGRDGVTHVPPSCLYNPINKARLDVKNVARAATKATGT